MNQPGLVRGISGGCGLLAENPLCAAISCSSRQAVSRRTAAAAWFFLDRLTRDEAQQYYERYIRPYCTPDGQVDLTIAQQAIDAVAAELGVAAVAADAIYTPFPSTSNTVRTRGETPLLGTVGGYEALRRLVAAAGSRDLPIALLEDAVAVGGGFLMPYLTSTV